MKEYKPKAIRTLRKMVIDIKQHCEHVSVNPVFGCLTCPYHVDFANRSHACYFEYTGGIKPAEWQLNQMGTIVQ